MKIVLYIIALVLIVVSAAIAVVSYFSPGQVVVGVTPELAATLGIGGFIVLGLAGVVGAIEGLIRSVGEVDANMPGYLSPAATGAAAAAAAATAVETTGATAAAGAREIGDKAASLSDFVPGKDTDKTAEDGDSEASPVTAPSAGADASPAPPSAPPPPLTPAERIQRVARSSEESAARSLERLKAVAEETARDLPRADADKSAPPPVPDSGRESPAEEPAAASAEASAAKSGSEPVTADEPADEPAAAEPASAEPASADDEAAPAAGQGDGGASAVDKGGADAAAAEDTTQAPAAQPGKLYVLEEKVIRGRPARMLSDGTIEAETNEGWMRFENLDHLNEYLDAMGA